MEDYPILYSKVVLIKDSDPATLIEKFDRLEIDQTYTIGKSIAVLFNDSVIGHLPRKSTRTVWRHIHGKIELQADIYEKTGTGWKNEAWYSMLTRSFELGLRIRFCYENRDDRKLFLAHITLNQLNTFPDIDRFDCPESLASLAFPVKDENGVSPLFFPLTIESSM